MSVLWVVMLDVSPQLLAQAEAGEVDPAAFLDTVRTSLPYAYGLIEGLAKELEAGERPFADNLTPPRRKPNAANCCAPWPATPSAAASKTTSGCAWRSRTATASPSSRPAPRPATPTPASPPSAPDCSTSPPELRDC